MCCSYSHGGVQHAATAATYPLDPAKECRCRGPKGTAAYCCGEITGEDGLCDRCRTHCKGQPPQPEHEHDHAEHDQGRVLDEVHA